MIKKKLLKLLSIPLLGVFLALGLSDISLDTNAATIPRLYFYANTVQADVTNGWTFSIAFEPAQNFTGTNAIELTFLDWEDGYWCRTAGALSVVPVSGTIIDQPGSDYEIDAALPGSPTANCYQGAGLGSSDRIVITNIDPVYAGTMYGFDIYGSVGTLGTYDQVGTEHVQLQLYDQGSLPTSGDEFRFNFTLSNSDEVTLSATVLPVPECSDNSECTYPVQICDYLQQCVPCDSDSQCNLGDVCVSGRCERDLSCTEHEDCLFPYEVCGDTGFCGGCSRDDQCGEGNFCDTDGVCKVIPPPECTANEFCSYPNEICDSNQECNPCTLDAQCNEGDLCVSGVCTTPAPLECTVNAQCSYPLEICTADNECEICSADWQCNVGDVCVDGTCTPDFQCESNDDCRFPDEVCKVNNQCAPCEFDSECGAGNICTDGVCTAAPPFECTENSQCNYPDDTCTNDGVCDECTEDSECNEGDSCVDGRCESLPPIECTVNEQCDYPDEVCVENNCIQCNQDAQCNFGDQCGAETCVPIPEDTPDPINPPIINVPVSGGEFLNSVENAVTENLVDPLADALSPITDAIVSEEVQEVIKNNQELAPVVATVNVATTSAFSLGLLNFGLMDAPILLLRAFISLLSLIGIRIKGQPYGMVYNALTKEPISNAMVRIFSLASGSGDKALKTTAVTDAYGVFDAELEDGEYSIEVTKNGFSFPSRIITTLTDYPLENIYLGGNFDVTDEKTIYQSIPIDPADASTGSYVKAVFKQRLKVLGRLAYLAFMVIGFVFSVVVYTDFPTLFNLVILLLYVPSIAMIGVSLMRKDPSYGTVVNADHKPIEGVSVGLFDVKGQRYVAKRVTDAEGKFRFIVPVKDYYVQLLDDDYTISRENRRFIKDRRFKDMVVIASELSIKPKEEAST